MGIDVTGRLNPGKNALGIQVNNGGNNPSLAGLMGKLVILFDSGAPMIVPVDTTWKSSRNSGDRWNWADFDDSQWKEIDSNEYWGSWMQDFVLRTTFTVPEFMDASQPIALYLPLGDAGDFSHPECLAYVDGEPYATCDRHHQEFLLKPQWCDGQEHTLALHGWTGLGGAG